MSARRFLEDTIALVNERARAGKLSRRQMLAAGTILGAAPFAGRAFADEMPAQIVHANWGGDAVHCNEDNYGRAFTEATGVKVVIDGSGPLEGTIQQQVESNAVIWDCCDSDLFTAIRLGDDKGLLEPIDYDIVDKGKVPDGFALNHGILGYWYSYTLAYDSSKIAETPTWADFFDVEKIPGKRGLFKWMNGSIEAALLADGVPPDQLHPLDVDRALAKINSIAEHVVYWNSGAESQQMIIEGEVSMINMWQTRASVVERDTGGRVKWGWDQAITYPAGWVIPKGNPAGAEWANKWVGFIQDPKLQIALLDCYGQGPANPAAIDMMTPEQLRIHPAAPENMAKSIIADTAYWAKNYDDVLNAYLDAISA
jgi:putative spermidine/putrescine transport system substrate-binding protein